MSIFKKKRLNLVKNFFDYKNIFFPLALFAFSLYLYQNSFDVTSLFNDVSTTYDFPSYVGIFSILGIFLWVSVFTICILTRNVLLKKKNKNKLKISFYNYACFLNFFLLIDDQFLLHEGNKFDIYFYFIYLFIILIIISKLKKIILKKEIIYFVVALLFFFASLIIDINPFYIFPFNDNLFPTIWVQFILEDILKFTGIYYWLNFFGMISSRIISEEINN